MGNWVTIMVNAFSNLQLNELFGKGFRLLDRNTAFGK